MSSRHPPPADRSPSASGARSAGGAAAAAPRQARSLARAGWRAVQAARRALGTALRHPAWRRAGRLLVRLAAILAAIALVCVLLIRYVLWPQASTARGWLEDKGSAALSAKVTIGGLETYWEDWHPAFRARDVRIVDDSARVLLATADLEGKLSWQSLSSLDLLFASVATRGADVLVQRKPDGRLAVAGMSVGPLGGAARNNRFLDWLLAQGRVDVADGRLRWEDEKSGLPVLEAGNIRIHTERSGAQHRVRVEATSPTLAGQPMVFQAAFRHDYLTRVGDWHNWTGQASWNLSQLQLPALQRYTALFERADSGALSADGTIEFRDGRVARSQARLRGSQIDLRLAGAAAPLRLASANALLLHRSDRAGENQLTIDTLLWQPMSTDESTQSADAAWREGMRKVVLRWTTDRNDALRRFAVKAPTLDLNVLRSLAETLPLESDVVKRLRTFQPTGRIDNLDITWNRDRAGLLDSRPAAPHYQVQGTMREVSVREQAAIPAVDAHGHPNPGTPGFNRLSGNFTFDDRQGRFRFDGAGATLQFPGVFEQPQLHFDELGGEVRWQRSADGLRVQTDGVRFANADTAGSVRGNWRSGGDGHSGIADLSGELSRAHVNRVPRYLPLTLPDATRHYLAGALVGGEARDVTFLVKGDLFHFPFRAPHDKAGDFRVEVPVHGVSYQIAPDAGHHGHAPSAQSAQPAPAPRAGGTTNGTARPANRAANPSANAMAPAGAATVWPLFTDIDGQVRFERGAMSFHVERAAIQSIPGVTLRNVDGRIGELGPHGHLLVDGSASGSVQGFLRYIATSPIADWTARFTAQARAQGSGDLSLQLDLPLDHVDRTKVQGQFRLTGNDVVLAPGTPTLGGASGIVGFDEHGFRLDNLRARFLGGELRLAGGTQPDGTTRVTANGTLTGAGITEALAGAGMAGLGKRLEGSTGYSATIGIQDRAPQVTLTSDLAGMALGLPAPLAKSAAQALPLKVELRPLAGRPGLDELTLQYGPLVHGRYHLRRTGDGTTVQAGAIGVQQTVPLPASGVSAGLSLDRLDVDAWRAILGPLDAGERGPAGDRRGPADAWMPDRIAVRARSLHAFDRDLDDVSLDAARGAEGKSWQMKIDSRQIAGQMDWREDAANPSGSMRVRLSRMVIPDVKDAGNVADALAANIETFPAIDLTADRFELRGHDFGKLSVKAYTANVEGEPVWTLQQLTIEQPGATLNSNGSWRVPRRMRDNINAQRRTLLNIDIDIRNAGNVLDRMGLPHTLRDGHGKLEGRVLWRGSPLSIDYPTLNGRLSLKLQNGQILAVDPGAAKLLGVLSLQSLLRLATFDFRGLAGEGFVFDEISGTGTIENGIATTDDFRLKAAQASATMTGTVDIPGETQNLSVALTPRINATSASVAAAFINPALGIGTLAAQLLFADEFSKAFTQHYSVTGNWANPQVTKVGENRTSPSAGNEAGSGGERAVVK